MTRWRTDVRTQQAAMELWTHLSRQNMRICELLRQLLAQQTSDCEQFARTCRSIASLQSKQWSFFSDAATFSELSEAFAEARSSLRQMGDSAGVPIEPAEQVSF